MKRALLVTLLLAVALAAGAAGFLAGRRHDAVTSPAAGAAFAPESRERRIAYYQHPDGLAEFSPTPRSDERGRPFVPVYEEEEPEPPPAAANQGRGRILYYRNPMGLPDVSPTPRRDSMGMDYIPVYENEQQDDGATVRVSLDRVQRLGVRTEPVARRSLARPIRAVGAVQFDERRQVVVAPRFDGWITRVHAGITGQALRRGDPLVEVYSPELLQAVQELRAVGGAGRGDDFLNRLAAGARQRLRVFGLPEDDVARLVRSGAPDGVITLRAAMDGIVTERRAVEGMRFMPGETLYRLADTATVWVLAEVFEQDIGLIAMGQESRVTVNAYAGRAFAGTVAFIYPTVARDTRTARVRIDLPNQDGALRADMYASVEIGARVGAADALTVPDSAVLDSGTRQIVLIERGEGRFEPRPVRLGARADGHVEILEGVSADERVVVSANFLIDAESNLRAALRAFTAEGAPR
jgi:Cu(I)/Ag(I) efflux system membrane fusion protein